MTLTDTRPRRAGREGIEAKANRLLLAHRVWLESVGPDGVVALVRGDSGCRWVVTYIAGTWSCSCPAFVCRCSHVKAVALVTERTHDHHLARLDQGMTT